MITPFRIESEIEADAYLTALLAKKEIQSISEIEHIAIELVDDERLRSYFVEKAKATLNT